MLLFNFGIQFNVCQKVFLQVFQNLNQNTCAAVFFNKAAGLRSKRSQFV